MGAGSARVAVLCGGCCAPPVCAVSGARPAHPASPRDLISESRQDGAVAMETTALVPLATGRCSHTAASGTRRGWWAPPGTGTGAGRCCHPGRAGLGLGELAAGPATSAGSAPSAAQVGSG